MTKEEIFIQLDALLDGVSGTRGNLLEINGVMVKVRYSSDLSDGDHDRSSRAPSGWVVFADGEFICDIEDGMTRSAKAHRIYESLPSEIHNTIPRKEQVVILKDRLGQTLGVFGSLGCAMKHLVDHESLPLDQAKWIEQDVDWYETLNGFKAEVWEVQRWETL